MIQTIYIDIHAPLGKTKFQFSALVDTSSSQKNAFNSYNSEFFICIKVTEISVIKGWLDDWWRIYGMLVKYKNLNLGLFLEKIA